MKKPNKLTPLEDQEQIALMQWASYEKMSKYGLGLVGGTIADHLVHIPNEAKRNKGGYIKQIKMGLKPGMPDLWLKVPRYPYASLFIELKRKSKKPTEAQYKMLNELRVSVPFGLGRITHAAMWTDNIDIARQVIIMYLNGDFKNEDWKI